MDEEEQRAHASYLLGVITAEIQEHPLYEFIVANPTDGWMKVKVRGKNQAFTVLIQAEDD